VDHATVQLSDASGRLLRTDRVRTSGGVYLLDMAQYSTGVYIVQLRSADGTVRTQRFLKP
jgi:hypothetical protein